MLQNAEQSGYYDDLELPAGVDEMDASDDGYEATEDDVLDLAMRVATGGAKDSSPAQAGQLSDDEDDDDEVLWQPRAGTIGDRRYEQSLRPKQCCLLITPLISGLPLLVHHSLVSLLGRRRVQYLLSPHLHLEQRPTCCFKCCREALWT